MPKGIYDRSPEMRERLRQGWLTSKQRKGIAQANLGRIPSPETREKIRQAHLGKSMSPEACEKMRQAQLGKKQSPETREKRRQAMLGHHWSAETNQKRSQAHLGKKVSAETRRKQRQSALKRYANPEEREKIRQARLRQQFPTKMTSIERLLRDEFKKRRLKFEMHKTMFGRWQPDFVFASARLIVQADGDYWHNLPRHRASDITFNEMAKTHGWTVWRFGEREIKMHAAVCAKTVAHFVNNHHN